MTMKVTTKFFASLREQVGFADRQIELETGATIADAWRAATGQEQLPGSVLMALNMEYAKAETPVKDGDELAFFPPVTGG